MGTGREQLAAWYEGALPGVDEVVEIPVMMSGSLAAALEEAARKEGLTPGRMLRRILRDFLAPSAAADGREEARRPF